MGLNPRIGPEPGGGTSSRLLALGLLAAAVLIALMGVIWPMKSLERGLEEEVSHYRRMLAGHQAVMGGRGEAARAQALADPRAMAELLLSDASDAAATAALHERVRELIAATRATLISIQALTPSDLGAQAPGRPVSAPTGPRRIGLRVQFAADLPGFQRVVHALESGRPAVLVSGMFVRARTARASAQVNPLDVQMDLVAFRRDGGG
jgi:hypothetical protein